jgi:hypothetical protein
VQETATEEEVTDLSNTEVVTKYTESARILNATLEFLVPLVVAGALPLDVMTQAEAALGGLLSTVYNGKKGGKPTSKGVAFPICLSVNERICNYSPLKTDESVSNECSECSECSAPTCGAMRLRYCARDMLAICLPLTSPIILQTKRDNHTQTRIVRFMLSLQGGHSSL